MLPAELEIEPEELHDRAEAPAELRAAPASARATSANASRCSSKRCREDTPYRAEALDVVRNHLDALAARDFTKLKKLLRCDDDVLRGVQKLIIEPQPAAGRANTAPDDTRYVIPGRGRAQGERRVGRRAQPGRDAEAAHQPHLRRHPARATATPARSSSRASCRKRSG